ncbi:MAG: ribonuclease R [Deltaproteobacteria bacterium]|nr:ribonuclease R [Deltaproteobacteria bacterium]
MEKAGRPLSFRELVYQLNIPWKERDRVKRLIKDMIRDGILVKIKGERYGLPGRMNLVAGRLECHPDGYGFLIPEDGGEDIFIGSRGLKGGMHKDRVVVRVEGFKPVPAGRKQGRDGRREGRVIRILERTHKTVVGKLEAGKGLNFVTPSDERILQEIIIPRQEGKGVRPGQMVVAELIRWPTEHLNPLGRLVEVLGEPDDPDVEIEVVARKYGLPYRFPTDVLKEAENVPQEVTDRDMKGRVDLRGITTFTIDGEKARDFDDAVAVEKLKGGDVRLWVSIADVSYYVKEGSPLDKEAYERGNSVYFPDRCIPMLPEALSNRICSLNPHVDRLAFTVEMGFDKRGELKRSRFYESVIRSRERLTYTAVKGILVDEGEGLRKRYSHILNNLEVMEELCLKLKAKRMEKGSIDFDLPEPEIILDIEGRPEDIIRSERSIAHQLIEEFMLAANKEVAKFITRAGIPFLYRVHEGPDEEKIDDLRGFIAGFGYRLNGGLTPKAFQRLLKEVEGRPDERVINHILLRSMKQARYSEENQGHFGLAFDCYTHFTSPIRRYPDLVVHRLLKRALKGSFSAKAKQRWEEALPDIADHTSARERVAMESEREVVDLKKAQFMQDKCGKVYDGFIVGVTSFGFFVELKDYFVEGLVHVSTLRDDYYTFVEREHSLVGERRGKVYRIGDAVKVKVAKVDLERRRIDMVLC